MTTAYLYSSLQKIYRFSCEFDFDYKAGHQRWRLVHIKPKEGIISSLWKMMGLKKVVATENEQILFMDNLIIEEIEIIMIVYHESIKLLEIVKNNIVAQHELEYYKKLEETTKLNNPIVMHTSLCSFGIAILLTYVCY